MMKAIGEPDRQPVQRATLYERMKVIARCMPQLSAAPKSAPRGGTRPTKERTETVGPVPPPGATGHRQLVNARVIADGLHPTATGAEPPSGKSKVLEDNLPTA